MWREWIVPPLRDTRILGIWFQAFEEKLKVIFCSNLLKRPELPEGLPARRLKERIENSLQRCQGLVVLLRNSELIDQSHRGMEGQLPVINSVGSLQFIVRVGAWVESKECGI